MSVVEMTDIAAELQSALGSLSTIPKPVVAAVTGYALGGGLEVALGADRRIAGDNAKLGVPEVLLGVIPGGGGTQRLARLIGPSRAKDMVFTGRVVEAEEAHRIGLVHRLVDGDLRATALEFAARFHGAPTGALGVAKSIMNRAFESDRRSVCAQEAMAQAMCRESAFHQEAVRRFVDKQPPLYSWPTETRP